MKALKGINIFTLDTTPTTSPSSEHKKAQFKATPITEPISFGNKQDTLLFRYSNVLLMFKGYLELITQLIFGSFNKLTKSENVAALILSKISHYFLLDELVQHKIYFVEVIDQIIKNTNALTLQNKLFELRETANEITDLLNEQFNQTFERKGDILLNNISKDKILQLKNIVNEFVNKCGLKSLVYLLNELDTNELKGLLKNTENKIKASKHQHKNSSNSVNIELKLNNN